MKICKDCKYYSEEREWRYEFHLWVSKCTHQKSLYNINPVSGYRSYTKAETMRQPISICGPEGLLYEEAPLSFWKGLLAKK